TFSRARLLSGRATLGWFLPSPIFRILLFDGRQCVGPDDRGSHPPHDSTPRPRARGHRRHRFSHCALPLDLTPIISLPRRACHVAFPTTRFPAEALWRTPG